METNIQEYGCKLKIFKLLVSKILKKLGKMVIKIAIYQTIY